MDVVFVRYCPERTDELDGHNNILSMLLLGLSAKVSGDTRQVHWLRG